MQLIVTEKPSVAQTIAKVLAISERKDGYIKGKDALITWCIGHLVGLADAAVYDEKFTRWNLDDLPIIPDVWRMVVSADKAKQYQVISDLMHDGRVTEIVCATDAGREGELIFRLVYEQAGCNKPVKRLWISSMEELAIRDGFANLKDGKEYDTLYHSALCRAKADWLVGINASRLYTLLYGGSLNVGRVQTPTLAMLVERHQAASKFQKQKYYVVHIKADGADAVSERIDDKKTAEVMQTACHEQHAVVESISKEQKSLHPPRLFNLTALQREANRLLGYTAQQTLDLTQSLYEKRLVTYPRTDSIYLTADLLPTVTRLLDALPERLGLPCDIEKCNTDRIIRPDKVTDHHAIIPTLQSLSVDLTTIPENERNIYRLICSRLLTATAEPHSYEAVAVTLECAGYHFAMKGRRMLQDGWKAIGFAYKSSLKTTPEPEPEEDESEAQAPELLQGATLPNIEASITPLTTNPPKEYTEDTLLAAMETAGVSEMHEDVERKGLGTPATRAGIIEKLIQSGYAERMKKQLIPTAKGMHLISVLPASLKSPALTAEWENALAWVADGTLAADAFMEQIKMFVADVTSKREVNQEIRARIALERKPLGACPRCGNDVFEGKTNFYCSNRSCGFALWKQDRFFTSRRKELTADVVVALLSEGKIALSGLYSEKAGKLYDAVVHLADTGGKFVNYRLEFKK